MIEEQFHCLINKLTKTLKFSLERSALSNDGKFRRALIRKTHGICQEVVRELKQLSIFAIMSGEERLDFDVWLSMHNRSVS